MKITGFFGRKEPVFIKFKDNKLIFVGENGLGKTTIMSILCYALTSQFEELKEYIFDEIIIKINKNVIKIKKEKLLSKKEEDNDMAFQRFYIEMVENNRFGGMVVEYRNRMPYEVFVAIARAVFYDDKYALNRNYYFRYGSPEMVQDCINAMKKFKNYYRHIYEPTQRDSKTRNNYCTEVSELLKKEIGDTIFLHLPTYRRIEYSPNKIFEDKIKFKEYSIDNYELYVAFGMADIESAFDEMSEDLKKSFDTNIKKIQQDFAFDVLNSDYDNVNELRQRIKYLNSYEIDKVIATLNRDELFNKQLKDSILSLKNVEKVSSIDTRQKLHGLFFVKILDFIDELDNNARFFTSVCNKYLVNKELSFDDKEFKLNIELNNEFEEDNKRIELSSLSSGEKQVVSLFCKLYLQNNGKKYFVIIDEPELSISVGWQKMFLKDVVDSPTCVGLFAVTHSPFIFDRNGLEEYTFDLDEMKEEYIFVSDEMKKEYIFDLDEMKKED
jgi:predicted ATPase